MLANVINALLAPLRVRLIWTATYDRLLRTADSEPRRSGIVGLFLMSSGIGCTQIPTIWAYRYGRSRECGWMSKAARSERCTAISVPAKWPWMWAPMLAC